MHYGNNKPKYIRYVIYIVVIVIAAILQNSPGGIPEILGARAFVILPACVSIAMFEREISAAVFGVFAGLLWDVSSGSDGNNAFLLLIICAVCSLLIIHFMRNNILTALVLGSGGIVVYNLAHIIFDIWLKGAGISFKQFLAFYLTSGIYTLIFVPIFYFIVSWIYNSHKTTDE